MGWRPLLKEKDLVDIRIMLKQKPPPAMNDAGQVQLRIRFPQRLEDDGIRQRVANAGAGEAEHARARPELNRPRPRRSAARQGTEDHLVSRGGKSADE
jgi:hypothetical protein